MATIHLNIQHAPLVREIDLINGKLGPTYIAVSRISSARGERIPAGRDGDFPPYFAIFSLNCQLTTSLVLHVLPSSLYGFSLGIMQ